MSLPSSAASSTPDRLHGLDALRAFVLLLGVALHAAMSFLPGAQYLWVAADSHSSAGVGLAFYVPHMFRMLLFFLLAGFFGRLLRERLGTGGFVGNRLRRIGIPLLAGWPLSLGAMIAVLTWAAIAANGGTMPATAPPPPIFSAHDFPLTHLWFLYELLLCYGAMLLMRALLSPIRGALKLDTWIDRSVALALHPLGTLLLAVPLMLAFVYQPAWFGWFGVPTPDRALYPNVPVLASYWLAFALGWGLHRHQALLTSLAPRWALHLGLAVALTGACLWLIGLQPALTSTADDTRGIAYRICYALAAWQWTFGLMAAALQFCTRPRAATRYLADASYWIYLAHLPLVMALQVLARPIDLSAWVKFPAIVAIAFLLLLVTYDLLVRGTWLGALLNGRRRPGLLTGKQKALPVSTETLDRPATKGASSR